MEHEFKIGDEVIIHAECQYDGYRARLDRVREHETGDWYYDVFDKNGEKIDWCFGHTDVPIQERFELIKPKEQPQAHTFKVGDKVEIVKKEKYSWSGWADGWNDGPLAFAGRVGYVRFVNTLGQVHVHPDNGPEVDSPYGYYGIFAPDEVIAIKGGTNKEPDDDIYKLFNTAHERMVLSYRDMPWPEYNSQKTKLTGEFKLGKSDNKENKEMTVSPQEVRNLKLTEEQRLLVEAGFTTLSGERTSAYDEVLMDKLATQYADEVVADLKAIAKAKKAAK